MRHYFDITLPYAPVLPSWPGEPKPTITRLKNLDHGDTANVTHIEAAVHYGTHVDAPVHFIAGADGVETLAPDILIGSVTVIDLPDIDLITAEILNDVEIPRDCERIIFKTRNSKLWAQPDQEFDKTYVAVAPDAAQLLVDRNIKLIGIDYLSIEPFGSKGHPTHMILLGAGVIIVEGLDLRAVEPSTYEMACLPLKLVGADGAPARVVLWIDE